MTSPPSCWGGGGGWRLQLPLVAENCSRQGRMGWGEVKRAWCGPDSTRPSREHWSDTQKDPKLGGSDKAKGDGPRMEGLGDMGRG